MQDLCEALRANDAVSLKALIDPALTGLYVAADDEATFLAFKAWLEGHDCVAAVEIGRGVLRSNPPIKEFRVTVRMTPKETAQRDFGLRLSPKNYEFDLR